MTKIYTFICCAMLFCSSAQANINYTLISESFYDSTRYYDLNNDGTNDFAFVYAGTTDVYIQPQNANSYFAGDIVQGVANAYDYGDTLGSFGWVDTSASLSNFSDDEEKYLMVKYDNGTTAYYGWFKINFTTAQPGIVSMAYNDVADEKVSAGQGDPGAAVGINEISRGDYGFNLIGDNISFKNCSAYDKVCFYNTNGQQLAEINAPLAQQQYAISINGTVIVSFFKGGRVAASTKQYVK